jgi:hypothetical protein
LISGKLTVTASMTEGGGSATSAPLTISLSDPPVDQQNLGPLFHQHAAHLSLAEQLHTHLTNPDLLLLPDHEGHDGSNKVSYSSPATQDTAHLAAAAHRMIEAMASFEANPAGIVSPVMDNRQTNPSDYLVFGPSPGITAVRSGAGGDRGYALPPLGLAFGQRSAGPAPLPATVAALRGPRIGGRIGPALPVGNAYSGFGPSPAGAQNAPPRAPVSQGGPVSVAIREVFTGGRARQGGGALPGRWRSSFDPR